MKIEARHIVAVVLLIYAWKGHLTDLTWPPVPMTDIAAPEPSPEFKKWADDIRPILPKMLPGDRTYLANFYDSMAFILLRDKDRKDGPIIQTTEDFAVFHGGSLEAAIDRAKIGNYPGLDVAIDKVFFTAVGTDEPRKLTDSERDRLIVACGVLTDVFGIGRDG